MNLIKSSTGLTKKKIFPSQRRLRTHKSRFCVKKKKKFQMNRAQQTFLFFPALVVLESVVVVVVDDLVEELSDPPETFSVSLPLEDGAHEDLQRPAVKF